MALFNQRLRSAPATSSGKEFSFAQLETAKVVCDSKYAFSFSISVSVYLFHFAALLLKSHDDPGDASTEIILSRFIIRIIKVDSGKENSIKLFLPGGLRELSARCWISRHYFWISPFQTRRQSAPGWIQMKNYHNTNRSIQFIIFEFSGEHQSCALEIIAATYAHRNVKNAWDPGVLMSDC